MAKAQYDGLLLLRRNCETLASIAEESNPELSRAALKAVMRFFLDGAPADRIAEYVPSDSPLLKYALTPMLDGIAEARANYIKKRERLADNGRRGGRPRGETGNQMVSLETKWFPKKPKGFPANQMVSIEKRRIEKDITETTESKHAHAREAHAPASGQAVPLAQAMPSGGDLSADNWVDRVETAPGRVALEVIGEADNERSISAMTNFQLQKDGAALRDCIRAFISELRQGEEPKNRGAALFARLKALPNRQESPAPTDGA